MIPIIDFSLHNFRIVSAKAARIKDFVKAVRQNGSDLFVFHDPDNKFAALVIPETVMELTGRLLESRWSNPNTPAAATGLLDILRQGQMTVLQHEPAYLVAGLADSQEIEVVIVVDDNQNPRGLFIPSVVMRRLVGSRPYKEATPELKAEINEFFRVGDLAGAIKAFESEFPNIHSESFNVKPSDPYVCSSSAGRHVVSKCPCKRHKRDAQAACGARQVAP